MELNSDFEVIFLPAVKLWYVQKSKSNNNNDNKSYKQI